MRNVEAAVASRTGCVVRLLCFIRFSFPRLSSFYESVYKTTAQSSFYRFSLLLLSPKLEIRFTCLDPGGNGVGVAEQVEDGVGRGSSSDMLSSGDEEGRGRDDLGAILGLFGDLGAIVGLLETQSGSFAAILGYLWPPWVHHRAILGPSWTILGHLVAMLGPSEGHLGAILGQLGAMLGHLGTILGHLGAA